jgi:hypothetical protein
LPHWEQFVYLLILVLLIGLSGLGLIRSYDRWRFPNRHRDNSCRMSESGKPGEKDGFRDLESHLSTRETIRKSPPIGGGEWVVSGIISVDSHSSRCYTFLAQKRHVEPFGA